MEALDNYVCISHIEQYSYCPEQAENNIKGLAIKNNEMEEGEKEHIKNLVRDRFKKSIQQNTLKGDKKSVVQTIIFDSLKEHNSVRLSEVFVKSEKLKIWGKLDEVIIEDGKISLIEYKTTFHRDRDNYYSIPSINQIIAYSIAFKEYFNLKCALDLIVKRVYLSYEAYVDYETIKADTMLGSLTNEGKMITNYWNVNSIRNIYEVCHFGDNLRLEEIKEIIKSIQSKNFKHEDNTNKCKKCQYNNFCVHSLISKNPR